MWTHCPKIIKIFKIVIEEHETKPEFLLRVGSCEYAGLLSIKAALVKSSSFEKLGGQEIVRDSPQPILTPKRCLASILSAPIVISCIYI